MNQKSVNMNQKSVKTMKSVKSDVPGHQAHG